MCKDAKLSCRGNITTVSLARVNDYTIKAKLKVAADAPLDLHDLRVRTASGISELRTFSVGALKEVTEVEPNNDFAAPQAIPMNVTVTGITDNEHVDYYVVEATKGDRITAEVEGMRLGITLFDPYVAIINVVRVYNTADGTLMFEMKKHTEWITAVEFSPDGVLLATGDRNNGLVVWESQTGRECYDLRGHTAAITDVSWRLDSNVVASSSEDGSIKLWELENGGNIKSIGAHGCGVESVRFAKDGRLVSTGRDRVVRVWDSNGNKQREFEAFGDIALEAVFSQDEVKVIAADWSGEIRVWNAKDGKRLANLAVNPAPVAVRLDQVQKAHAAAQAEAESLSKQLAPLQTAVAAAASAQATAQQEMAVFEQAAAKRTALVGQHDQALKAKLAATANLANLKKNLEQASAAMAAAEKTLAEKRAPSDAAIARAQALKAELEALSAESKRASARGGLAAAGPAPAQTTR